MQNKYNCVQCNQQSNPLNNLSYVDQLLNTNKAYQEGIYHCAKFLISWKNKKQLKCHVSIVITRITNDWWWGEVNYIYTTYYIWSSQMYSRIGGVKRVRDRVGRASLSWLAR